MTRRAKAPDPAQLSLFEAPVPVARIPMPAPDGSPRPIALPLESPLTPPQPAPTDPLPIKPSPRFAAPPPIAGPPDTVTLANLLAPAVFRHPQADREIRLNEHLVAYSLKRVRRRSIGFMVGADGLSVNAPKWIGMVDIESALHEKSKWILRKLGEQQERSRRLAAARIEWRDGTTIPFLGEPLIVVVDPRAGATEDGSILNTDAEALPGVPRMTLHVGLPHTANGAQLRDAVQCWLQRQARRLFEERCQIFTQRVGVRYTRLRLSSAQTRWGSASADGTIRLNWRLIHFSMATIDYVVAHELAHLREMNHSPRFWEVVRSVLPDFEAARDALKEGSVPMFD